MSLPFATTASVNAAVNEDAAALTAALQSHKKWEAMMTPLVPLTTTTAASATAAAVAAPFRLLAPKPPTGDVTMQMFRSSGDRLPPICSERYQERFPSSASASPMRQMVPSSSTLSLTAPSMSSSVSCTPLKGSSCTSSRTHSPVWPQVVPHAMNMNNPTMTCQVMAAMRPLGDAPTMATHIHPQPRHRRVHSMPEGMDFNRGPTRKRHRKPPRGVVSAVDALLASSRAAAAAHNSALNAAVASRNRGSFESLTALAFVAAEAPQMSHLDQDVEQKNSNQSNSSSSSSSSASPNGTPSVSEFHSLMQTLDSQTSQDTLTRILVSASDRLQGQAASRSRLELWPAPLSDESPLDESTSPWSSLQEMLQVSAVPRYWSMHHSGKPPVLSQEAAHRCVNNATTMLYRVLSEAIHRRAPKRKRKEESESDEEKEKKTENNNENEKPTLTRAPLRRALDWQHVLTAAMSVGVPPRVIMRVQQRLASIYEPEKSLIASI